MKCTRERNNCYQGAKDVEVDGTALTSVYGTVLELGEIHARAVTRQKLKLITPKGEQAV